jgi:subtilisin family serine protease
MAKRLARLFLASLIAVNGIPAVTAPGARPIDRQTVLQEWANALGMSGDLTENEIPSIEYWGTGTINENGQPCTLTDYHASVKYQVPGMRLDFTCADASGQPHHEIQVVANNVAWNEAVAGSGSVSAMGALNERLTQLWTGPLALVKAAAAAGPKTRVAFEAGKTVVTFPVPGVVGAMAKATLNARHQAERVDTRLSDGSLIQTTYTDYAKLDGADLRFDTFFPHRIVQKQGDVTLVDLTVAGTSTRNVDLILHVPDAVSPSTASQTAVAAPQPDMYRRAPKTWKNTAAWAKLDGALHQRVSRGCDAQQSVIIRTKPGYRGGLRDSLKSHGNELNGEFPVINAVGARVACDDLETLASFNSTLSMSMDAPVAATQAEDVAPVDPPALSPASSVDVPLAPPAPAVASGDAEGEAAATLQAPMLQTLLGDHYAEVRTQPSTTSIGIAIIDSGIAPGPDFGDRITAFYDFTQGDVRAVAPSDGYGHGTHVAGLAASRYVGVNPQARLIGLKVLNDRGQGSSAMVLRAIEFAIVNRERLNIQVLNLSLGHPIYERAATDPMVQAVESAVRVGLVVVVAAGNVGLTPVTHTIGYSGIVSPANAPSAYSIGAVRTHNTVTRADDQIALFSSRGPTRYDGFAKPDFSAPGQNLLSVAAAGSTLQIEQAAKGDSGRYMHLNGTSMAAGVVSGVVALALQANPAITPNALKAVLEYSAVDVQDLTYTGSADFLTQGTGEISGGALTLAAHLDARAPAGAHWLTASLSPFTLIDGTATPWVQRLLFGNYPVSGADLLDAQRPAFALEMVWGNSLVDDADNVVWGNSLDDDNVVWGNSLAEDLDNIVWGNSLAEDLDNIVWGNSLAEDLDNIVWGNSLGDDLDNIVWGNSLAEDLDNIVWGNSLGEDLDNIVWGNSFDDAVDNVESGHAATGGGAGGWLKSPGTRIVIHSTAFQTALKKSRRAGDGRTN